MADLNSITFKHVPSGTWVVLTGETVNDLAAEVEAMFPGLEADSTAELFHLAAVEWAAVGNAVHGLAQGVATPAPDGQGVSGGSITPSGAEAWRWEGSWKPGLPLPSDQYGEYEFKTGNKNGREWAALMSRGAKDAPGKGQPVWAKGRA